MKKLFTLLFCLAAIQTAVLARDDKPISVEQLPANAKQFIEKHFAQTKVSYAKMDDVFFDKSYDVIFADGNKIEFDKKGDWKEINCKYTQVPKDVIPDAITKFIVDKHNDAEIIKIDRDRKSYDVKLNNGIELKFDFKYNFIRYDD